MDKEQAYDTATIKAMRDKRKVKNLKCPEKKHKVKICKVVFEVETNKSEQDAIEFYKKKYPNSEIIFNHIPNTKKKV